jgi:hypothetical protein
VVRERKNQPGEYDAKPWAVGGHRGWFLFDLFSASAVVAVYDALGPENQARYNNMHPVVMANMAFKLVK